MMNGYELLELFGRQLREAIEVPNSWLPEEFRDERTDSVTLADLERKCDIRDSNNMTDHEYEKAEKAKRILLYTEQVNSGVQELTYLQK